MNVKQIKKAKSPVLDKSEISIDYMEAGETTQPSDNLLDYCVLLYGESAIGKTSILTQIPDCYIVQFDPKRVGLKARQTNIPDLTIADMNKNRVKHSSWDMTCSVIEKALNDDSVKCIGIDNFGLMYEHAVRHVCWQEGIKDPQENNDYGKTWNVLNDMFRQVVNSCLYNSKGLFIVSHDVTREVEEGDGSKYDRIEPALMKGARKWVKEVTDFAFYMRFYRDQRVITVRNSKEIWVKCCTDIENPRFVDSDGNLLHNISAGASPQEAWSNLLGGFNNEINDVDREEAEAKLNKSAKLKKKLVKKS